MGGLGAPLPHVWSRARGLGRTGTHSRWLGRRASVNWHWRARRWRKSLELVCVRGRRSAVLNAFPNPWHPTVFPAHGNFRPMTGYSVFSTVLALFLLSRASTRSSKAWTLSTSKSGSKHQVPDLFPPRHMFFRSHTLSKTL